jgi:predicted phosphodiesterase
MGLPEHPPHRTIETMMRRYFGGPCNIVVHGDTHVAEVEVVRGTLLVNPGSPMYRNMNVSLDYTLPRLRLSRRGAWWNLSIAEGPF